MAETPLERPAAADGLERRLLAAFAQSPTSTVVYDAAGRPLAVNPAFERLWGATIRDVPAEYSVLDDPQLEAAGVLPMIRRAFAGEPVTLPALRYEMASAVGRGRVRWTDAQLYPVRDASGAIETVVLMHNDVTERVAADTALGQAVALAERQRLLAAALSVASTEAQVADAVVAHAADVFGAAGVVIARLGTDGMLELMRAGDMPDHLAAEWRRFPIGVPVPLADVARTGEPIFLESRDDWRARYPASGPMLAATGHHANVVVPLVVDGCVLGALGAAFDQPRTFDDAARALALAVALQCAQALERARLFEAERNARAEAEAAEARLRDVVEQAPLAVALLEGPDHVYTIVSPRYAETPGGGRPLLGRAARDAFPEVAPQGFFEEMDCVYETGVPYAASERRVMIDSAGRGLEERWFNVGYQPMRDAAGGVYAIASVAYDVTDLVRARLELEAAWAEAQAANQAKAQFLAVMSHELRTPLNAIGGYAELLEMGIRGPVTAEQREDLRRIQTSQRHLLGLINEVLNYAKLETGTVQYDVGVVLAREALLAAEALVSPQARAKGLVLAVAECPPGLALLADPEKLRQILVNLLSNAVKFTDRGGRVDLSCEADAELVRVRVRDTGIGIPADKLQAIFEPFVQVRAELTRTAEGTGLGLAISRDLARGMGGDLIAESELGAGSVLTLTLPRTDR